MNREQPKSERMVLFSIDHEGQTFENYIKAQLRQDIRLLCDVLKNSKNMKFGFSINQLEHACTSVGIRFMHLPAIGIDFVKRQQLHTQADYDATYRQTTLVQEQSGVEQLAVLVSDHQRVAITCFEDNIHQCHRLHLVEAVGNLPT